MADVSTPTCLKGACTAAQETTAVCGCRPSLKSQLYTFSNTVWAWQLVPCVCHWASGPRILVDPQHSL